MNNNFDNVQQTGSNKFENVKNVRTSTRKNAEELLNNVASARTAMNELAKAIITREKDFTINEISTETVDIVNVAVTLPITEDKVSQPNNDNAVESVATAEPSIKIEKSAKVEKPVKVDKAVNAEKTDKIEKVEAKVVSQVKPASTDDGKNNQKTYTDEKGNIKVRRFITDIVTNRPAQTTRPTNVLGTIPVNSFRDKPDFNNNRNFNNNNNNNNQNRAPGAFNRPQNNFTPRPYNNNPRPAGGGFDKDSANNNNRPFGAKPPIKKTFGGDFPAAPLFPQHVKSYGNKNKTPEKTDDKKAAKKSLTVRDYFGGEDDRLVSRRPRAKKEVKHEQLIRVIDKAVVTSTEVSIKTLSEKIGVSVSEIIKQLFKEGIVKTINDTIDYDYAAIISSGYNVELELKLELTFEEKMLHKDALEGEDVDNVKRPPIVTVMGHVDHGKTSLLDALRSATVASGEAGGITQHIGAYTVKVKGEIVTFIDTPGHAAFTAMRQRGAKVTDIAILVVAADDGVMPQTIEALNHAKAADVPIIVAINKMDKPNADPTRVMQQLTEYNILPEEWGGDSIMVPISAKTGNGLDKLLESVLLVAEVKELKANPNKKASGTVIESQLDKGKGPVATILVSNGTLKVGEHIVAGTAVGKVRAMFDDKGRSVKQAGPSVPVSVLGFSDVPLAGDFMYVVDEKLAKQVAEERKNQQKVNRVVNNAGMSLDDIFGKISEGQLKALNIIIKTDVQGSLEALKKSLVDISNEEVRVNALHGGVGAITETDVMLAKASNAIIIAFNVRPDSKAKSLAESESVDIRQYKVIYDAVDDVTKAMKGLLTPKYKETILGQATVREVFKITNVGAVAGSYVTSGKITRSSKVRVYRDDVVIYDGTVSALKRFKDDVKEVVSGFECGISITNYSDLKANDTFEAYIMEEIAQ